MKIMLDPGHGGIDPGAVANGIQEKEVTREFQEKQTQAISQAVLKWYGKDIVAEGTPILGPPLATVVQA